MTNKEFIDAYCKHIEFTIKKHGTWHGHVSVEDAVNSLNMFEFLERLSETFTEIMEEEENDAHAS